MAYDFHYTPTGTGAISGKEVLEQTEDAINDLGNTAISGVQEALDKAGRALTNSENAVDDAQTALNTANNAEGVAIQAQTDVGNLSGTVTNIGNRVTTAEGNISNLQGRMTTAEGNITNLQGRMTTAEGNIGNLQTAVSTAQATANSAQQTAATARQQSYVFRYSSTALVASSTNSNTLLDNTDNLKVGDKVIDSSGVLFSITAIDTANSTFTIGTALVDLATDSDVVHKSGDETVGGIKTFSDDTYIKSLNFTNEVASPSSSNSSIMPIITTVTYTDQTASKVARINLRITASGDKSLYPHENNQYALGLTSRKWSEVHATTYYYGSSDTEFSDKFVTTDTGQTISGAKTFNNVVPINGAYLGNEPSTSFRSVLLLRSRYDTAEKSGWLVSKFRSNSAQGALSGSDTVFLNFDVLENEVRTNGILRFNLSSWSGNTPGRFSLIPNSAIESYLGTSGNKWDNVSTKAINGLEPSALGMPDFANGIDISSYITIGNTDDNYYTPPVNGWLWTRMLGNGLAIQQGDFGSYANYVADSTTGDKYVEACLLVTKDVQATIRCRGITGIIGAKFYPCQGNV